MRSGQHPASLAPGDRLLFLMTALPFFNLAKRFHWASLLLAAILVAACSARAQSAPATAPPQAAGGKDGVTESTITLGVSAAFSGPSRSLGIELYRGAQSYFAEVNEKGGVNGRKIVLRTYDDGYQPDPAVRNTMSLMLDDKVFLLFGYVGTPTVTRVLPLLKKFQANHVYLFFPFTGAEPQREPPYGEFAFNLRASYQQETAGLVNHFVEHGRRRIAVFYQADAYGRSGWAGVRKALKQHGLAIVGEATYRRGTKFTESLRKQAELIKAATPDAIICVGAYAACGAFARDAYDLGLRVPMANVSFVGSENMLKLLAEVGADSEKYTRLLVNSQVAPSYEDARIPAVREYRELLDKHNPNPPAGLVKEEYKPLAHSFVGFEGFLDAKMIVEILRRLGGQPDRAQLERAVFSIHDFDLGIGEKVSFGPDRRQGLQEVYYTVVENNRFVPLENWEEWLNSPLNNYEHRR